jgi:hypothetical protein
MPISNILSLANYALTPAIIIASKLKQIQELLLEKAI